MSAATSSAPPSENKDEENAASSATPSTGTAKNPPVPGSETDAIVTKQQNVPLLECLALVALISGSLSMYWGISGMIVGGAVSSTIIALFAQPMILVHVVMSTCVVILAPVVTVQKVQLRALGTLREQQNELRSQVNTLQQSNDDLSLSITSISDQTKAVDVLSQELQQVATATGTTIDRLLELGTEQERLQLKIRQKLQAQVLQQIMNATLRTDADRNFVVSADEVPVLMQRLQQIPGIQLNERAFHAVLERSEPAGALTLADMGQLARELQDPASSDEAVFKFQPNAILGES
jgi:hypothetical protein